MQFLNDITFKINSTDIEFCIPIVAAILAAVGIELLRAKTNSGKVRLLYALLFVLCLGAYVYLFSQDNEDKPIQNFINYTTQIFQTPQSRTVVKVDTVYKPKIVHLPPIPFTEPQQVNKSPTKPDSSTTQINAYIPPTITSPGVSPTQSNTNQQTNYTPPTITNSGVNANTNNAAQSGYTSPTITGSNSNQSKQSNTQSYTPPSTGWVNSTTGPKVTSPQTSTNNNSQNGSNSGKTQVDVKHINTTPQMAHSQPLQSHAQPLQSQSKTPTPLNKQLQKQPTKPATTKPKPAKAAEANTLINH